jgi:hypothetical protein
LDTRWHILFCDAAARICPVSDFLSQCKPQFKAKIVRILDLLEEMGPNLPRPYADTLHDGIHELRLKHSGDQVRLLYFFCHEVFIIFYEVVHKHTDRVPERSIEEMRAYREEFLRRLTTSKLEEVPHGNL